VPPIGVHTPLGQRIQGAGLVTGGGLHVPGTQKRCSNSRRQNKIKGRGKKKREDVTVGESTRGKQKGGSRKRNRPSQNQRHNLPDTNPLSILTGSPGIGRFAHLP